MATHLITGGASGIGAALVDRLHARGDTLHLVVRSASRAADVRARWSGVHTLVADLARPESLAAAVGGGLPERLDSLVHSAGMVRLAPVGELTAAEWATTLAVNLGAPAELTRLALPALRAGAGTAVFVNSGAGLRANPVWGAYAASKFGLRALADALRGEERESGVRVTTVYPGRTATPMQAETHRQEGRDYDPSRWIDPNTVATAILTALDLPRDAELPDLTITPGP